ncbi:Golgi integral membrane protein 4-like isoform X1 [Anguilla rostrata]|uniref:Golgi integral membrane protein 4-like isoform X1 n=1 Tax=Anguilla rostrata TaxID=7938 RepID=UPI0030CFC96C
MLGLCWRRQKCSGLTALSALAACAACAVLLLLLTRLRESAADLAAQAQRCRDQQEALSAQLQVVYEHRSRLERSLQKERLEHKKTKEDFLLYKLEAQEALNKEKQDAMNRYSALSSQNSILKNQLTDMRTQLLSQQTANGELQLGQRKALEECKLTGALQRTETQDRIASLQDTVMKLKEESRLLRKAHQDVHSQLVNAQAQVEGFQQGKLSPQKAPGGKGLSIILPHIDTGKQTGPQLRELKDSVGSPSSAPGLKLLLVNSTQSGHHGQVTIAPLSQSKQRTQLDIGLVATRSTNHKDSMVMTMDKWPGEEGQEHQLDSWNSLNRKNNYNQSPDKNFLSANQRASSKHWRGVATNEIKSTVPEEINEDRDFVERLDNGDLEIDSQGEEMAQGPGAIAQEPMEDGRVGETEDQLEEEDEEDDDGGNEEEY